MTSLQWIAVCLLVIYLVPSAFSASYWGYRDDYGGNNDYGGGNDYGATKLTCYSCEYGVEYGEIIGSTECSEDFIEEEVPQVYCDGICKMEWMRTSEVYPQDFMIHRECVKTHVCKEIDSINYQSKCCHSNLCNKGSFHSDNSGANSSQSFSFICISVLFIFLFFSTH